MFDDIKTWVVLLLGAVYFLPTIIAWGKKQFVGVLLLNFFLGLTVIGWLVAFIWSFQGESRRKFRECPHCMAQIPKKAAICMHCKHELKKS